MSEKLDIQKLNEEFINILKSGDISDLRLPTYQGDKIFYGDRDVPIEEVYKIVDKVNKTKSKGDLLKKLKNILSKK